MERGERIEERGERGEERDPNALDLVLILTLNLIVIVMLIVTLNPIRALTISLRFN